MSIFSNWLSKKKTASETIPATSRARVLPSATPKDRELGVTCEHLCDAKQPLDLSVVERLLAEGANPSAIDRDGFNALDAVALKYTLQRDRFQRFTLI